jgi:hypothetical protein
LAVEPIAGQQEEENQDRHEHVFGVAQPSGQADGTRKDDEYRREAAQRRYDAAD